MATLRYFVQPDGSIEFMKKGPPPQEVPGYEVDPGNPYHFLPILPPCEARIYKDLGEKCCPTARFMRHCTKFNLFAMTPQTCNDCAKRGENVVSAG